LPDELADWTVLWFVIDRVPDVPAKGRIFFVRSVPENVLATVQGSATVPAPHPGGSSSGPPASSPPVVHVRDAQAAALADLDIPTPMGWLEEFRRQFGAGRTPGSRVLLFPGAGHPLKQWPLVQYFQLADRLERAGLAPTFVLGPAELERGLIPGDWPRVAPEDLQELTRMLLTALAVVGGDTGPMHLAGMLGVPGVALFGPTSFARWGPVGLRELSLTLPCSPCTITCADLACPEAVCLGRITPDMVFGKLKEVVDECKTGFQGPGFLESRL
jgi:ADP-heptose:LPS heptosyltransferase